MVVYDRKKNEARVAVVGGGIGGLTATLALLRAGVTATCFERSADAREAGAGIQIGPNAARILYSLGAGPALAKVECRPGRIEIRRWSDGRILRALEVNPQAEAAFGAPYLTLHRGELHAALRSLVPSEVLRLGAKVTRAVERGGRITLELEGQAPFEGDAVVGADGLRSTMRALIHDDRARFSGKVACRVLVPAGDVPELVEPPTLRMWLGPGGHLVSYPVSGGRFLTLAAALSAKDADQESWTREGEVEEMREALRGWDPVVHAILGAAKKTLRLPLYDRAPVARMGRGRLTLLGDAAHPMLPFFAQGAAQAIEDACVLARCIAGAAASDLPDRLRRYEALRSSRAAEVQRRSTRNGRLFQLPDGVRQWARDLALGRLTLASFGWLYRYDAEALPLS